MRHWIPGVLSLATAISFGLPSTTHSGESAEEDEAVEPAFCAESAAWAVVCDGEFRSEDWSDRVYMNSPAPGGQASTLDAVQAPVGGNPGAYRRLTHVLGGGMADRIRGYHVYEGAVYDPAVDGAVAGIDFFEDHVAFEGGTGGSLLLFQGGKTFLYRKPWGFGGNLADKATEWETRVIPLRCRQPADFFHQLEATGTLASDDLPDFSAQGAPIQFGFYRNCNHPGSPGAAVPGETCDSGLDNFRVVVYKGAPGQCGSEPPDLRLELTDGGHLWGDDLKIPYEVTVSNQGGTRAQVAMEEIVPVYTTFAPGRSDPAWSCPPGAGENSLCQADAGELGPGEEATLRFGVDVAGDTNPGLLIFDEAIASSSGVAGASEVARASRQGDFDQLIEWNLSGSGLGIAGLLVSGLKAICECSADPCRRGGTELPYDPFDDNENRCFPTAELLCNYCPRDGDCPAGRTVAPVTKTRAASGTPIPLDPAVLFRVRDRILRPTAGGRRATELFYEHVVDIVAAAAGVPDYFAQVHTAASDWLPLFAAALDGRGGEVTLKQKHVAGFRAFFDLLRPHASPALRAAIDEELPKLGLDSWAGLTMDQAVSRLGALAGSGCQPTSSALCLNDGRFRVEASWRDFAGKAGAGRVEVLTADTGYFWFFRPDNIEVVVKVLRACRSNNRFWVFAGGLTDVEVTLTVTDTLTGAENSYFKGLGMPFAPITDTAAFATCDATTTGGSDSLSAAGALLLPLEAAAVGTPTGPRLPLADDRFEVEVEWQTAGGMGTADAVQLTDEAGYFWFFRPDNVEMVVKVLRACRNNNHFWVFAGGLTDQGVTMRVTDTVAGVSKTYRNPLGRPFQPITDTTAFATCP